MSRFQKICQILNYKIIQNISNIMSLVSQNDTKWKWRFIQRIYHSQLVWEPDKKIPREKTMKSIHKNDREKILSCILQNFISINSLHIVSGLNTNNTKEEKMEKVESCQKYHNFGPNIESSSSTVFYHNMLATLVTACKRSNSCFLVLRHNQLKMLLTCIKERWVVLFEYNIKH